MSNVAEESTVPIYYGVKVDTSINPGTYSGSVLYTVLINNSCLDYTVVFNPNVNSSSTSEITGTMSDQSIMYGETTALSQNAYTRAGYNFLGWSTSSTGKTGTVVNGIGTTADVDYADEADVLNLVSGGGIVTLYAIWELALPTMQNWEGCTALNTNEYTTLVDSRDGEKYVVKKLADGKCWMVQNLRLINKTLTPADSNVSANFTVPASTPAGSSWCTSNSSACDDKPLAYYDASTRSSYGALYNWYTATAGTGTYNTSSGTVSSSICPKGWRLPTGGASGEFAALDIAWGGTGANRSSANTYSTFTGTYTTGSNGGFDLAGYIAGSSLNVVGENGYWWSSTAGSRNTAYRLYLGSGNTFVYPQDDSYKYSGRSVRCIMEPPTMQNTACSSLPAGQTSTLPDARDNQDYTIYRWPTSSGPSRMKGYCIMTKDLSLGYVTGGSVTKDANLILTADTSAAAGTITARPNSSGWSSTNSDDNLQYANGPQSGKEAYSSHSYYSFGAAQKVCPKGWRLPTKAEYDNIATFMGGGNSTGSSTIRSNPYNFVYGGYFASGGWGNVGSGGNYWSSTQYDSSDGYILYFNSSDLDAYVSSKNGGRSVRCIAEPTMQSFDASTSLLNIGDMATLTDARDGEKYVVKRLPDGKVWMVQNLRLINKTITPADSNVSSNFTVPTSTPAGSSWCTSNSSACDDQPLAYYDASTRSSYGANYNWYTATAGTGKYETTSGNVSSSICPKGWRLPTGGSSGEF
ncbi:MAG: InlB B-repeat-containing protein, partial [Alistipes sp.]|nr:InlB B-repeat-containing protein [Alistipes sp.]